MKTVYDDVSDEVRSYSWDPAGSGSIIGPLSISREDRQYGYSESRTLAADGTTLLGLSRTYLSEGGQVSHSDQYFNLSGITYSTSPNLGTEGTNYYRSSYEYEKRGRTARTESPTGTITHSFYDAQGRTTTSWIGTDDTPTSDILIDGVIDWRDFRYGVMVNGVAPAGTNLVKISQSEYDGGGVGDGNLTKTTQFPGGTEEDRVSEFYYDWRNRQVASKSGVRSGVNPNRGRGSIYLPSALRADHERVARATFKPPASAASSPLGVLGVLGELGAHRMAPSQGRGSSTPVPPVFRLNSAPTVIELTRRLW